MKFKEKLKAIHLRKEGASYKEILKKIKVSKATLSHWLKNIELTAEQKQRLMTKKDLAAYRGAKVNQKRVEERRKFIVETAKDEFPQFIKNPLFIAGLMLYWAEGNKRGEETVIFSNSDPELIRLMMRWFREICHIPEYKFRISLYLHTLHVRKDVRKFWAKVTGIPTDQFIRDVIKPTIYSQRTNKLYEGTCRIVIHNKDLFRRIMGWKDGVVEYFNKHPDFSIVIKPDLLSKIIFQSIKTKGYKLPI